MVRRIDRRQCEPDPTEEGRLAHRAGESMDTNPYPQTEKFGEGERTDRYLWFMGWLKERHQKWDRAEVMA